jgi:hypothetical protein
VRWGGEIGLTDAERNDLLAGPDQLIDLGKNDKRVFGTEAFGPARQFRHRWWTPRERGILAVTLSVGAELAPTG